MTADSHYYYRMTASEKATALSAARTLRDKLTADLDSAIKIKKTETRRIALPIDGAVTLGDLRRLVLAAESEDFQDTAVFSFFQLRKEISLTDRRETEDSVLPQGILGPAVAMTARTDPGGAQAGAVLD